MRLVKPKATPNQSVVILITIVASEAAALLAPANKSSATKLPSAAPKPPGKTSKEPKIEEKEKIKIAEDRDISTPTV